MQNDKSQFDKQEIERLKQALNVKESEIKAITERKGKIRDSVKLLAVQLDAEKHKVWTWEKKYESGSVIKATMSEKDSVLKPEIDLKILTTDHVEKYGFLKLKKRYYTDFYTPDQNIQFEGAKVYRKENIVKPKRFGFGLQGGVGVSNELKPIYYIGIGGSYNLVNF